MKRMAAIGLVLGAVAGPAAAGPGGGHVEGLMHRMDLNGDGSVSAAEADAMREVRFLRWDSNGDGVLTEAEMVERMRARIEARIAKRFARLDRNGDGRVERAEFEAAGAERFARMDADGDGRIGAEEFRAGRHRHGHGGSHGVPPED